MLIPFYRDARIIYKFFTDFLTSPLLDNGAANPGLTTTMAMIIAHNRGRVHPTPATDGRPTQVQGDAAPPTAPSITLPFRQTKSNEKEGDGGW